MDEAERNSPKHIRKMLIDYGGKTPTGKPMWRLVRAGDCRILCQGRMHEFPRGVNLEFPIRPTRISGGVMLLPRYRDIDAHAWILQKWFPPSMWGNAAEWAGARSEEMDTPLFVEQFPSGGDYFMLAGPWQDWHEAGDLRAAISLYLRRERSKTRDTENFIRARMAAEVHERAANLEKMERELNLVGQAMDELTRSVSVSAQKVRDGMAAAAGLEGHLGASEAWG